MHLVAAEDHPQMKGNYTARFGVVDVEIAEDHPQMKGNYTGERLLGFVFERKTIPK